MKGALQRGERTGGKSPPTHSLLSQEEGLLLVTYSLYCSQTG